MNNIINWFTRKKVLYISLVGILIFFLSYFSKDLRICSRGATYCGDYSEYIAVYFLPFVSIFIFSLIVFKLKEHIFNAWVSFSIWAISASLIIITFLPIRTHGLDFVSIVKGPVILFLTIVYSIFSLILIIYKSFQKE